MASQEETYCMKLIVLPGTRTIQYSLVTNPEECVKVRTQECGLQILVVLEQLIPMWKENHVQVAHRMRLATVEIM